MAGRHSNGSNEDGASMFQHTHTSQLRFASKQPVWSILHCDNKKWFNVVVSMGPVDYYGLVLQKCNKGLKQWVL